MFEKGFGGVCMLGILLVCLGDLACVYLSEYPEQQRAPHIYTCESEKPQRKALQRAE